MNYLCKDLSKCPMVESIQVQEGWIGSGNLLMLNKSMAMMLLVRIFQSTLMAELNIDTSMK